jgi:hypothetical protein
MRLFYTLIFFFLSVVTSAQAPLKEVPLLERKVSINASNEKTSSVLNRIGQAAGFSFSYNSAIIPDDQTVSIQLIDKSVRDALNEIFQGTMNYKVKSNYVILTKAPAPAAKNNFTTIIVNGYVQDAQSGEKIALASVYEKKSLASSVTDQYGYFNLKLEKKTDTLQLSVSKRNYIDTLVNISTPENQYITIFLNPAKIDTIVAAPKVDTLTETPKQEIIFPYVA